MESIAGNFGIAFSPHRSRKPRHQTRYTPGGHTSLVKSTFSRPAEQDWNSLQGTRHHQHNLPGTPDQLTQFRWSGSAGPVPSVYFCWPSPQIHFCCSGSAVLVLQIWVQDFGSSSTGLGLDLQVQVWGWVQVWVRAQV